MSSEQLLNFKSGNSSDRQSARLGVERSLGRNQFPRLMNILPVHCLCCQKILYRNKGRINEAKKFNWKTYCSSKCEAKEKNKQQIFICSNLSCKKEFKRLLSATQNSQKLYCSRSCAATVNNSKFPKRYALRKNCNFCSKEFTGREKYCSTICKNKSQTINAETIIQPIKSFYNQHGRIPLKREFLQTKAARKRFGSWNKAIKAAGFKPNPVIDFFRNRLFFCYSRYTALC